MTKKNHLVNDLTSNTYCMILQTVPTSFELILTIKRSENGLNTNEEI